MKTCTKCKIEKSLDNFHKDKLTNDGLGYKCKNCVKEYDLVYKSKNKDKNSIYNKEYHSLNKDKKKLYQIGYYDRNPNYHNDYYHSNKDIILEKVKIKKELNPLYKLTENIRSNIGNSFLTNGYKKNSKTHQILGCTFEEFFIYLESRFESWMNWGNKGKYNGEFNYGWDLDHIIPISSAKTEEDIYKLNHYTNFQPLCSHINRDIKRDKPNY